MGGIFGLWADVLTPVKTSYRERIVHQQWMGAMLGAGEHVLTLSMSALRPDMPLAIGRDRKLHETREVRRAGEQAVRGRRQIAWATGGVSDRRSLW